MLKDYYVDEYSDIDLLIDDVYLLWCVINVWYEKKIVWWVFYVIKVVGKNVLFDFCYMGDGYYDIKWER